MGDFCGFANPWEEVSYMSETIRKQNEPLPPFQNELKTQQYFYSSIMASTSCGAVPVDEDELSDSKNVPFTSLEKSKAFRESANSLYKKDKEAHAWEIYELYTCAMFIAPSGSVEVALAHANRAACLMTLKLYREAYDDCECALLYGYEEKNVPKLRIRQMHCASALKSKALMTEAIGKTRKYESCLNKEFQTLFFGFVEEFETLEELEPKAGVEEFKDKAQKVCSSATKGRFVLAEEDISAHDPIMSEKAFASVPLFPPPTGDHLHTQCANCALDMIIPFPCHDCKQMSFCSLNCKRDHEKFHKFDCVGLRNGLLRESGINLLVLRTFLTGFQELPSALKNEEFASPKAIWKRIFNVANKNKLRYHDVLQIEPNLDKMESDKVFFCSFASIGLVLPLLKANFFAQFASKKSSSYWEIAVAALLMRHTAQMMFHTQKVYTIASGMSFHLIFKNNGRIISGKLHLLSNVTYNLAFYPRLALYSRSCQPNIHLQFNKSVCNVLADKPIGKGKDILNYYGPNAKRYAFDDIGEVERNFFVHCKCRACASADAELIKENLVICVCQVCNSVFTPSVEKTLGNIKDLSCTQCGTKFVVDWFRYIHDIFATGYVIDQLARILEIFARVDACSSGPKPNHKKAFFSHEFLDLFIKEFDANPSLELSPATWDSLINFAEKWLEENEEHFGFSGLDYAKVLAIYLDMMTLNGRKLQNMDKIQNAVQFLPNRIRDLYAGYIEDYLKP